MQPYVYGHNRPLYLRQLGALYVLFPERTRPYLDDVDPSERTIVAAEVALAEAKSGLPIRPLAQIRAELFDE